MSIWEKNEGNHEWNQNDYVGYLKDNPDSYLNSKEFMEAYNHINELSLDELNNIREKLEVEVRKIFESQINKHGDRGKNIVMVHELEDGTKCKRCKENISNHVQVLYQVVPSFLPRLEELSVWGLNYSCNNCGEEAMIVIIGSNLKQEFDNFYTKQETDKKKEMEEWVENFSQSLMLDQILPEDF